MRLRLAALLALVIAALVALALLLRPQPAPQVSFPMLDGALVGSERLRGRVVLVSFWATTCAVCLREMPQLIATHERYAGRGLETVAVAMAHDRPDVVAQVARAQRLPFRVAFDPVGAIARAFDDTRLTPTLFVIDRQGRIVRRIEGAPDFPGLHALIERLLA